SNLASVSYTIPAGTPAGSYTIFADYNGATGLATSLDHAKTLTINPANASVAITWATPQTYNGGTHPAAATVTGPVSADNPITSPAVSCGYFAGATAGLLGTGSATATTNASNWTVRAYFAGNTNYNSSSATKTIVIDAADTSVAITWATP